MESRKILMIDDDKDLSLIIQDMYEDYGYHVTLAESGTSAYELLRVNHYDLILLDINLPDATGFEICEEIRKLSALPIIFASARTSENDRINGFDIGGDDYLPKPYSLKELLARTNSLIRRAYGFTGENEKIIIGAQEENEIVIDTGERTVTRCGTQIALALKEYDLLLYLAKHRGKAVKKETLLSEIWGTFSEVEMSTLTVHIRWLREKLEEQPSKPKHILTVWGIGYKLV